jgi:hypothetical protein
MITVDYLFDQESNSYIKIESKDFLRCEDMSLENIEEYVDDTIELPW